MTQRRPRRRPGENRERLLEAGLIEFGLFGYHGASTSAIAARADVPQPHLYASFATKRDLFLSCCARAFAVPADDSRDGKTGRTVEPHTGRNRLLMQAIAVVRDPRLQESLEPLLQRFIAHSGETLSALLDDAAASLLATDA